MPDREKVIQGLQELTDYLFHEYKVCYHGDEEDCYNRFLQADNALNLLKEQEKKKVHCIPFSPNSNIQWT